MLNLAHRYLDHQASKEAKAALAALEAESESSGPHRRHADKLLLLLRATCTGAALLNLNETNRVLRAAATAGQLAMGHHMPAFGPGAHSVDEILTAIPKMEISKAMLELMKGRERAADKDFVSYAAKQNAWRSDGRAYASLSKEERIAEGLLRAGTVGSITYLFVYFVTADCVVYRFYAKRHSDPRAPAPQPLRSSLLLRRLRL